MTPEEIYKAAKDGKQLQRRKNYVENIWLDRTVEEIRLIEIIDRPCLFRIKPEPKTKAQEFEESLRCASISSHVCNLLNTINKRLAALESEAE